MLAKEPCSESTTKAIVLSLGYHECLTCKHPGVLEAIAKHVVAANYTRCSLYEGSFNLIADSDTYLGAFHHFKQALEQVVGEVLRQKVPGQIELDQLLSILHSSLPRSASTYQQLLLRDHSRFLGLYAQMQAASVSNANCKIDFHFICNDAAVIEELAQFLSANQDVIPYSLIVHLHATNQEHTGFDSSMSIEGTGDIDYNYRNNILRLGLCATFADSNAASVLSAFKKSAQWWDEFKQSRDLIPYELIFLPYATTENAESWYDRCAGVYAGEPIRPIFLLENPLELEYPVVPEDSVGYSFVFKDSAGLVKCHRVDAKAAAPIKALLNEMLSCDFASLHGKQEKLLDYVSDLLNLMPTWKKDCPVYNHKQYDEDSLFLMQVLSEQVQFLVTQSWERLSFDASYKKFLDALCCLRSSLINNKLLDSKIRTCIAKETVHLLNQLLFTDKPEEAKLEDVFTYQKSIDSLLKHQPDTSLRNVLLPVVIGAVGLIIGLLVSPGLMVSVLLSAGSVVIASLVVYHRHMLFKPFGQEISYTTQLASNWLSHSSVAPSVK